jgi:type I site-specific restriction endonuclease
MLPQDSEARTRRIDHPPRRVARIESLCPKPSTDFPFSSHFGALHSPDIHVSEHSGGKSGRVMAIDKISLSEQDLCAQFITPAIQSAGWDLTTQIRFELSFTAGQVIMKGKSIKRGKGKRADYVLSYRENLPLAVVEAKDNTYAIGSGMQQALLYADGDALDLPFVFSSNGDGFRLRRYHVSDLLAWIELKRKGDADQSPTPHPKVLTSVVSGDWPTTQRFWRKSTGLACM